MPRNRTRHQKRSQPIYVFLTETVYSIWASFQRDRTPLLLANMAKLSKNLLLFRHINEQNIRPPRPYAKTAIILPAPTQNRPANPPTDAKNTSKHCKYYNIFCIDISFFRPYYRGSFWIKLLSRGQKQTSIPKYITPHSTLKIRFSSQLPDLLFLL